MMQPATERARSLYVHIPFCERKCHYCDFVSVAGTRGEAEYVNALSREIVTLAEAAPGAHLDTIFLGGGTPGLVDPAHLAALLDTIKGHFEVSDGAEITLEANPSSTSEVRASAWLGAGFNRVSIGVQSLHGDILEFLGRVHDRPRAVEAVAEVKRAGFEAVSCDLIYAVPGLDDDRWRQTVSEIADWGTGHVSAYELTVEEGTPLHRLVAKGRVRPADPEAALRQHWMAVEILEAAGLAQYEVSNFARPGAMSRHNLVYWRNQTYLAAGVGAHGHVDPATANRIGLPIDDTAVAVRYWHGRSLPGYIAAMDGGKHAIVGSEIVDATAQREEEIMLGLRLAEGIRVEGLDVEEVDVLVAGGLLRRDDLRVAATRSGQDVLNEVAARLVTSIPGAVGAVTAGH